MVRLDDDKLTTRFYGIQNVWQYYATYVLEKSERIQ